MATAGLPSGRCSRRASQNSQIKLFQKAHWLGGFQLAATRASRLFANRSVMYTPIEGFDPGSE